MTEKEYNELFKAIAQASLSCTSILALLSRLHADTAEQKEEAENCIILQFPNKKSNNAKEGNN